MSRKRYGKSFIVPDGQEDWVIGVLVEALWDLDVTVRAAGQSIDPATIRVSGDTVGQLNPPLTRLSLSLEAQ